MNRLAAFGLGALGALLFAIPIARAQWLRATHISQTDLILSGIVAAIGLWLMLWAFKTDRSAGIPVVLLLLLVAYGYDTLTRFSGRSPLRHTMADLRTVGTAVEARATDVNAYPAARNLDELARVLEPTYIRHLPRTDQYGNALRYEVWQSDPRSHAPDHYAVASAGHDWKWEKRSLREYPMRSTSDTDSDIVYSDGKFVSCPNNVLPPTPQPQQTTTDPKALFDEATTLYRSDLYSEAIPKFERVLQSDPNNALANARLGMSLGQVGRLKDAIPYLEKACALDASDYQSRSNLGLVYEKLGRPADGVEWEREAVKISPDDPAVLNNFGWVLLRAGRNAEAVPALERAVKLAPQVRLYRDNLASARRVAR